MRIVNLQEFRKLPKGTVFAKYSHCEFDELMVLDEIWECDFIYSSLIGNVLNVSSEDFFEKCTSMENGNSENLDFECTSRDGLFDDDQLFAVYEKEDIKQFIEKLQESLR